MNKTDHEGLREFVSQFLADRHAAQGKGFSDGLRDDCDLLLSGLVDSLGLLELMTSLQEYCGREIDFDALDPEKMTVVGPLCDFVAGQMAKG